MPHNSHGRRFIMEADRFWADPVPSFAHHRDGMGDVRFDEWGRRHRAMADELGVFRTILEWGPGGGAIAAHFTDAETYYGADISEASLTAATQEAGANFVPVHHRADEPERVLDVASNVDLVLCITVFQHMATKPTALAALAVMARATRPGGVLLLQTRRRETPEVERYEHNWVHSVVFGPDEFTQHCADQGLRCLWVRRAQPDYTYHAMVTADAA